VQEAGVVKKTDLKAQLTACFIFQVSDLKFELEKILKITLVTQSSN